MRRAANGRDWALGAACDDAVADIAKQVADMSQTDCDTAIAYALGGGRGYGGIYGLP